MLLQEELTKTKFQAGDVLMCCVWNINSSAPSVCGEKGEAGARCLSLEAF